MELSGKQRRQLRAMGHHLRPLVQVGRSGVTDTVVAGLDAALEAHELVKIRFGQGFEGELDGATSELATRTGSTLAGHTGRTALLFRQRQDEPAIRLV